MQKTNHISHGIVALVAIMLYLCVGCTTKREIVMEVHTDTIFNETHDTITITHNKVDTIYEYKVIHSTDTIRDVQTRVITLRESGDTIREVINNNLYHYVYQKDSTDKYKTKIDSLQQSIKQMEKDKETILNNVQKETTKTKTNNFWKYVSIFLCGIMVVGILYILWIKLKK